MSHIFSIIEGFLGKSKSTNSSFGKKYDCPNCALGNHGVPDKKYNLEVCFDTENDKKVFHCWKCGIKGSIYKLFKDYADKDTYLFFKELYGTDLGKFYSSKKKTKKIDIKLPTEFISFKKMDRNEYWHMVAYDYIKNERNVPDVLIEYFNIGFAVDGKYAKRLIIPSYDEDGNLNYFITRKFFKKEKNPYKNPLNNKTEIVINESNINYNETVYLVEGYFDMFALPTNTAILGGKELNSESLLLQKLLIYKPNVVVALDPDASLYADKIRYMLENNGINVKILFLYQNDLGEMNENNGKKDILEILKNK